MAKPSLLLLLLLNSIFDISVIANCSNTSTTPHRTTTKFIKNSCSATSYPAVCVKSLPAYAAEIHQSPRRIALAALKVSIHRARSAKKFVIKLTSKLKGREYQHPSISDCVELMGSSFYELSQSAQELKNFGSENSKREDFLWHMSNVQAWVSSALTFDDTCFDEAKALDPKLKASIRH